MRKTALFFAAALFVLMSGANATDWVRMGHGDSAEVFYAAGRMQHYRGIATAWMREDFHQPQRDTKAAYQFDQTKIRRIFDCKNGTAGVMQATVSMRGHQVDMMALPFELARQTLAPVPANSFVQQVMNLACALPEAPFVQHTGETFSESATGHPPSHR